MSNDDLAELIVHIIISTSLAPHEAITGLVDIMEEESEYDAIIQEYGINEAMDLALPFTACCREHFKEYLVHKILGELVRIKLSLLDSNNNLTLKHIKKKSNIRLKSNG